MYAVEMDKAKRVLVISAAGHVTSDEVKAASVTVRELLRDVAPGLRALTDLRLLTSMDSGAARHIAEIMEMLKEKKLVSVTRIIPDPHKDIGFNILSLFHYDSSVRIYTVESLAEAMETWKDEE